MPDFDTPVHTDDKVEVFVEQNEGLPGPPGIDDQSLWVNDGSLADEKPPSLDFEAEMISEQEDSKTKTDESNTDESDTTSSDVEEGDEPDAADLPGEEEDATDDEQRETHDKEEDPGISLDLAMRAGQLGLTPEQVRLFGGAGEEVFKAHLDSIETSRNAQQESEQQGEGKPSGEPEPTNFDLSGYELDFGEESDDYSDVLKGQLKGISDHNHEQNEVLMSAVKTVAQGIFDQGNRHMEGIMNDMIDDLMDDKSGDYKASLGAGTDHVLSNTQAENRVKVMDSMQSIHQTRFNSGLPVASPRKVFNQAMKTVFGRDTAKNSQTNVQLNKRKSNGMIKNGKRQVQKVNKLTGTNRAILALSKKPYADKLTE